MLWRKIRVSVCHRLHQRRATLANCDIQGVIFPPIYHGLWHCGSSQQYHLEAFFQRGYYSLLILCDRYFFGQRDTGGNTFGDYFHLEIAISGGVWTPAVSICDVANRAAWTEARNPAIPAGSTVQLRIQASDGIAAGDIIDAGIDDINICPMLVNFPTTFPTPSGPIRTCATRKLTSLKPTTVLRVKRWQADCHWD